MELLELSKYEEGYRLLDYQTLISFIESKHNIMDLDVATKRCNQGSAPWLCPTFYKWAKEAAQRSQIKAMQKFDAFLTLPFQFWVVFILVLNIRLSILPPAQPPPLLFVLIFFSFS